jgi:hypothetical protein
MRMNIKYYKGLLVFIVTVLSISVSFSQVTQSKFQSEKKRKGESVTYLLSGPYNVEIPDPKRTKKNIYERGITTSNGNYNFVMNKKESVGTLFSAEGQSMGSFSIKGKNKYDITMTDGTVYDWRKGKSNKQWIYLVGGKEVVMCTFTKKGGKKYLQYDIKDAEAKDLTTAMTISHIYGVDFIDMKSKEPILWIGAIAGAVFVGAASSSSQPSTY